MSRVELSRPPTRYLALALLAPLILATACLSAAAVNEAGLASGSPSIMAPDQLVNLCVSVRLSGGWRAATWWEPAVSNRTGHLRRPFIQPNMACGLIPWQAWLPSTGDLETSN